MHEEQLVFTSLEEAFKSQKGVKTLNLSRNTIESIKNESEGITALPEKIGELENLEELIIELDGWVTYPPLSTFPQIMSSHHVEVLPESIGKLKKLRILKLQAVRLKTLPESISELENLEELDLSFNEIIFRNEREKLSRLPKLKRLDFYTYDYKKQQESTIAFQNEHPDIEVHYDTVEFFRHAGEEVDSTMFDDSFLPTEE